MYTKFQFFDNPWHLMPGHILVSDEALAFVRKNIATQLQLGYFHAVQETPLREEQL